MSVSPKTSSIVSLESLPKMKGNSLPDGDDDGDDHFVTNMMKRMKSEMNGKNKRRLLNSF